MTSFTLEQSGTFVKVITKCRVGASWNSSEDMNSIKTEEVDGVWDTGCTHTSISEKLVVALGLAPLGVEMAMQGLGGIIRTPTYKINVILPGNIIFGPVNAPTAGQTGHDLIIGMDLISLGDFALSNQNGKSYFSFRCPSEKRIDFYRNKWLPRWLRW